MADEYISREAFKAEALRLSTHYLNEWDTLGVLAAADRTPAADVAPVRHGRWAENEAKQERCGTFIRKYWNCSECGIEICSTLPVFDLSKWHYCPNCGALMSERGK